jgi:anti-anti-sigma regulatory factor
MTPPARKPLQVKLVVLAGKSNGKTIDVTGPLFLIGRSPDCHLRPNNPMISRVHAAIEQREGRVYVRDHGTTNGTRVGDKMIRGDELEVRDGELLTIGPLQFRLAIEGQVQVPFKVAGATEPPKGQILEAGGQDLDGSTEVFIIRAFESSSETISSDAGQQALANSLSSAYLSFAILKDVLVATVIPHELEEETTIEPVRYGVSFTLEINLPRRVILDLSHVDTISKKAVIMLLGQSKRFAKAGGSLRLCHVKPAVVDFIEHADTPGSLEYHATFDEAVTAARKG